MSKRLLLSFYLSFFTLFCANAQVILNEGFENGIPSEWKTINQNNESKVWETHKDAKRTGESGARIVRSSVRHDDWLITPKFIVKEGTKLSFYAKSKNNRYLESMSVKLSKESRVTSDFSIDLEILTDVPAEWTKTEIKLQDIDGVGVGDEVSIAFQATGKDEEALFLDDVLVEVQATTPVASVNMTQWDAAIELGQTASSNLTFELKNVGQDGLSITGITDLSGSAFQTTITSDDVADLNLKNDESLRFGFSFQPTEATAYQKTFVIQTNGGADITIQLNGSGIEAVEAIESLTESFENGIPDSWSVVNGNDDEVTWESTTNDYNTGTKSVMLNRPSVGQNNDWLISPKLRITQGMKFSFYASSESSLAKESIKVAISKTGKNIETDFTTVLMEGEEIIPAGFTHYEVTLPNPGIPGLSVDDEIYIAFQGYSEKTLFGAKLYIDDATVTQAKSEAEILTATVSRQVGDAVIDTDNHTVTLKTRSGLNLSSVRPRFTLSEGASINPDTWLDFSAGSIVYTVTAANGTTQEWTVFVKHTELPYADLDKDKWDAGNVGYGQVANSGEVFTLTNKGTGTLLVDNVSDLSASPFSTTFDKDAVSLTAGESYSFGISYEGTEVASHTGQLVLTIGQQELSIELTGNTTLPLTGAVTELEETFEEGFPQGWSRIDNNDDGETWRISSNKGFGNSKGIIADQQTEKIDEWLILPTVKVLEGSTLSFHAKSGSSNDAPAKLNIKASKTGKNISSDFVVEVLPDFTLPSEWAISTFVLSDIEGIEVGDEVTLAFRAVTDGKGGFFRFGTLHLDNIIVNGEGIQSNEAQLLAFSVPNQIGLSVVDVESKAISAVVPFGTDRTAIEPIIEISEKATISPEGPKDFTAGSVTYTITAEDGVTQNIWTVSVEEQPVSASTEIVSLSVGVDHEKVMINSNEAIIHVLVPQEEEVTALSLTVELGENAMIAPALDAPFDFTEPKMFTVTAQSGASKEWTVVVEKEIVLDTFSDNFESGMLSEDWITLDEDGNKKDWKVIGNASFRGEYGVKTTRNQTQNNDWLISPKVKVSEGDILFFLAGSSATKYKEDFNVLVSKGGSDPSDFAIVLEQVTEAPDVFQRTEYEYLLSENANIEVGDTIRFAIQVVSQDKSELHVDEIHMGGPITTSELALDKKAWRSVVKVDASQTSGEFNIYNVWKGALTIESITELSGTPFTTTFNASEISLAQNEKYSFTFSFNPTALGEFEQEVVITTSAGIQTIHLYGYSAKEESFHETFEANATSAEWLNIDRDEDGHEWFSYLNNPQAPELAHSGEQCMISESAYLVEDYARNLNNWLVSPKLTVQENEKLIFWVAATQESYANEHYSVLLSNKSRELDDFTEVLIDNATTTGVWTKVEVDLSAFANQKVFVAFRHHNGENQSQIKLDDIIMPALHVPAFADLKVFAPFTEYTIQPVGGANFPFTVGVDNLGAELTDAVAVVASIEGNEYSSSADLTIPFGANKHQGLEFTNTFEPTEVGTYEVNFAATFANDEYAADNQVTYQVQVSDSVLARDTGYYDEHIGTGTENEGAVGQTFTISQDDVLTSISFYLVEPIVGDQLSVTVMSFNNLPLDDLANSEELTIESSESGWYHLRLTSPLELNAGTYFLGVKEKREQDMKLAVDRTRFKSGTAFIKYQGLWLPINDAGLDLAFTPLIRANFGVENPSAASITAFSFGESSTEVVIDEDNRTVRVTLVAGVDLSTLVSTIKLSEGANLKTSLEEVDFSEEVTLTVVAQDGTELEWTITVLRRDLLTATPDQTTQIYPNPTKGTLNIELTQDTIIRILSPDGKSLQKFNLNKGVNRIELSLPAGVYYIQMEGGEFLKTSRIILQ